MTSRDDYLERLKKQLDQWDSQISKLEAKKDAAVAEVLRVGANGPAYRGSPVYRSWNTSMAGGIL